MVNMDKVAEIVEKTPQMIISRASAYARDWDYARFREIADSVDSFTS